MTDTTTIPASVATAPIVFSPTHAELTAMAAECRGLKIRDVEDRTGYAAVHDARMRLKSTRVAIEKTRVALKADALAYGKRVDTAAKELTALIEPTELELDAEESRIDAEKARLKAEAEAARKAKLDARVAAFASFGVQIAPSAVEVLSDEEYESQLGIAQAEHAARLERERLAAEQKARDEAAQAEILAAQKAEVERIVRENREAQAKLDALRRAFEAEQARARQVQLDAEAKAKREAEAQDRAREQAQLEAAEALPVMSEAGPVMFEPTDAVEREAIAVGVAWSKCQIGPRAIAVGEVYGSDVAAFVAGYLAGSAAKRRRAAEGS